MIFVDMSAHDLVARTAQYQLRHSSPSRYAEDAELLSSYDNTDENRPLSRRRDSGANRTIPPAISNSMFRSSRHSHDTTNTTVNNNPFPLIDIGDDSTPPPRTTAVPETLGFDVTTSCNDPSSDEEEPSSEATLADLYRRDRLPPPYASSTDEDDEDTLERAMRRAGRTGVPSSHRRSRRRAEPSRVELVKSSNPPAQDAENGPAKDVLAPHAKFFIERDRSVVSIKFDPPV